MSNTVFFDSKLDDDARRSALYSGQLFVYSPVPSAVKLCNFGREMVEEAFGGVDPLRAHETLPVEQCVEILAKLKPAFIHHPKSKQYIQGMLQELGCDLEQTYFDVPRMRSAYPTDYLTSGIAYAFQPHRDTWYSAPFCQINWWLPIYEVYPENVMAFHPRYWDQAIKNGSDKYNYYEWNKESRKNAAQHIKTDTRVQPHAEEPIELDPQVRLITPVGGATVFSAAQLHSTVPNTAGVARYSIDFRTVHFGDAKARRGAPNLDSACTGTTMRDYLRGTDFQHLPDEVIAMYDDGTAIRGEAVFTPQVATLPA